MSFLKTKDCKLKALLEKENINFDSIKEEVIKLFGEKTSKPFYMEYTLSFKKILENAILIAKKRNEEKVSIDVLSIALLELNDCVAYEILSKKTNKINQICQEIKKQLKRTSDLDNIFDLTNLNQKALKNPPILMHRENEIKQLIEVLLRKQKQNAIILGEPGVGKTALVEYLASLINKGEVCEQLKDKNIYELDIASIIAGTKYRGEFEEKLKKILKKVKEDKNAILFIDEIHNIIGAGGAEGAIDASNIIKPYLSRGEICCIGATTFDEYTKLFEKEKALERRFQVIKINEPTLLQTYDILKAIKGSFIKFHKIKISDEILETLTYLCKHYVFDRNFPDKAIDILDIACVKAKNSLKSELDKETIIEVIETNYNVKIQLNNKVVALKDKLNSILFGQEKAIAEICDQLSYIELGINDDNRPLGVFLFVGPTGVGKTEMAKQISNCFFGSKYKYIKLDMSEYNDSACVSKLIGAPPGYVGFERPSLLVEHMKNNPHSVVVLDEVEKANRDIMDVFLNVFDEGYFMDASKRKIDFTNSIIIMTSNLGFSEELFHKDKIGYVNENNHLDDINSVIKKHFRPEFLNRIDDIVYFNSLSVDTCKKLIDSYILQYQKKISIPLDYEAITNNVINNNEIKRYGARGIKREVKKQIVNQISKQIVYKA